MIAVFLVHVQCAVMRTRCQNPESDRPSSQQRVFPGSLVIGVDIYLKAISMVACDEGRASFGSGSKARRRGEAVTEVGVGDSCAGH